MNRVIVVGSPRVEGRSAQLAEELFNACIDECPEDGVSIVSVASTQVGPCTGCDACRAALDEAPEGLEDGDPLSPHPAVAASDASLHQCVVDDDMPEVRKHLDAADELVVVTPVYFASVPAQLKCLLDRLQPYYYSDVRRRVKRPMILHVVGEGGDPHGFEPLIGTVRSAFAVAGFELVAVLDWTGKIDASGEIIADAEEHPIPPVGGFAAFGTTYVDFDDAGEEAAALLGDEAGCSADEEAEDAPAQDDSRAPRPELSLSAEEPKGGREGGKGGPAPRGAAHGGSRKQHGGKGAHGAGERRGGKQAHGASGAGRGKGSHSGSGAHGGAGKSSRGGKGAGSGKSGKGGAGSHRAQKGGRRG